jgi:hypothetical protein
MQQYEDGPIQLEEFILKEMLHAFAFTFSLFCAVNQ